MLIRDFTTDMAEELRQIAASEPPPKADNMRDVRENCQGWTLRVVRKFVAKGVIPAAKYNYLETLQEPVRK